MIHIKIILGSTRQSRFGEHPAHWIYELAKKQEGIQAELLDLRDYPMPFFEDSVSPSYRQGEPANATVAVWAKKIGEADAFIVVTPEYNHGYPGVLKNAFDHLYKEWNNKAIGFVSYGNVGGARSVEQLRLVSIELQMAPIRTAVHIPSPWNLQDQTGKLKEGALEPFEGAAQTLLNQLIWWAQALKTARQEKTS